MHAACPPRFQSHPQGFASSLQKNGVQTVRTDYLPSFMSGSRTHATPPYLLYCHPAWGGSSKSHGGMSCQSTWSPLQRHQVLIDLHCNTPRERKTANKTSYAWDARSHTEHKPSMSGSFIASFFQKLAVCASNHICLPGGRNARLLPDVAVLTAASKILQSQGVSQGDRIPPSLQPSKSSHEPFCAAPFDGLIRF